MKEEAYLGEAFPEEWIDGIIVKMPKNGNLKICDNWQGICILPAISKIISKIIVDRNKNHLYPTIDREPWASHLDLLALTTLTRCG